MTTKVCTKCGVEKELNEYQFRTDTGKYRNECKACVAIRAKASGKIRQDSYGNNKKDIKETTKICTKCGKEKNIMEFYYRKDAGTYRNECIECWSHISKKYRKENKKLISFQRVGHRRNNIILKIRNNISTRIRFALKSKKTSKNGKSILKYLYYTLQEFKDYIESLFEWWMNWDNWGKYNKNTWDDADPTTWTWQLDHIIPHSAFNYASMEDEEFKKCWSLENLRPYSAKQNILDGNRRNLNDNKDLNAV